ncbi:alpha/beta hydrolase [Candidatus Marimicrobium litorale]|uniref:Alpha/beta hydrolase n=1 Tax=Candidatus Marimicrobium litorale TaxID=2518991 RepID=A0ABT3T9K3_9GAMM|nr:alpha/beta hydrolase [Candidatus Marimicrobium litorale]MCX2978137.1 alpha/beta hydrolase [Candidatus Marimicrobium litorale]
MSLVTLSPGQLQTLRAQLPLFGTDSAPALAGRFCQFYGIDFAERLPHVGYKVGRVDSGSYSLAVHSWVQPGAINNLFLVHGYFDHTGLFGKLAEWALLRGCNVLSVDLPGHGLSTGEPAVIDDFGDYSRAIADVLVVANLPTLPLWTMAQSTGGAALVDYAAKYDWPFSATVLLAPLVRPAQWFAIKAAHILLSKLVDYVPRTFGPNSADRDFLEFVKVDPLQSHRVSLRWLGALRRWLAALRPVDLGVGSALVIQGESDLTVDWQYNVGVISRLFPASRVVYLPGAGHHLAGESNEYRDRYLVEVATWLTEQGIPLQD